MAPGVGGLCPQAFPLMEIGQRGSVWRPAPLATDARAK